MSTPGTPLDQSTSDDFHQKILRLECSVEETQQQQHQLSQQNHFLLFTKTITRKTVVVIKRKFHRPSLRCKDSSSFITYSPLFSYQNGVLYIVFNNPQGFLPFPRLLDGRYARHVSRLY